jgi:hypothetical protein
MVASLIKKRMKEAQDRKKKEKKEEVMQITEEGL